MAGDEALGHGVGDHAGQQRDGADGVVVARDRVVDVVRVAVGVEDADDRDAQLLGFVDREVFLLGVDDPDGRRGALHVADTAEGLLELVLLATQDEQFLLGVRGTCNVVEVDLFEFLEAAQTHRDGLEVREHTAEPTLVDVGLTHALSLLSDGFLGLLLGADEEDRAAVGHGLLDEFEGVVDVAQRLLQVDDVDAVALGEDEALHLRVPTTGLVSKVNAAVEQLADGDDGHADALLSVHPQGAFTSRARRPFSKRTSEGPHRFDRRDASMTFSVDSWYPVRPPHRHT